MSSKVSYHCGDCDSSFEYETSEQFSDFMREKASSDNKPCRKCVYMLASVTISTPGKLKCFVCDHRITFPTISELGEHFDTANHNSRKTTPVAKVKCQFCESFFNSHCMKSHILQHHPENASEFTCDKCGKRFRQEKRLKEHLEVHDDVTHGCQVCTKQFATKTRLQTHIRNQHRDGKMVRNNVKTEAKKCPICQKNIKNMILHLKNVHGVGKKPSDKIIRCMICYSTFKSEYALEHHMNSLHEKKITYDCDVCGKSFLRKVLLWRHKMIHSGEKRYKCLTCGVSFNQKCTLTRHQVIHTGEKPFECGICGQRFTQKPYMKTHEKKCKGEKPKTKKHKKMEESSESEEDLEVSESEEELEEMSESSESECE